MNLLTNIVDLAFPLVGASVPLDHGYALFAALSRLMPELRTKDNWGVHPIRGRRLEPGVLGLTASRRERSTLKLRVPADEIGRALTFAGSSLELDGHRIVLGAPTVHALEPSPSLRARFVTVKSFEEPSAFADALRRQMAKIPDLGEDSQRLSLEILDRRVLRVRGTNIPGFRVAVSNLTPPASIALQVHGLGGRRHMGAGIFVPLPRRGQLS